MEEGTALAKGMGQEQTWHLYLAAQSKEGWIFINSHGILETSYNLFKKRVHTQEVLLSFKDSYTAATNHHHRASLVPQRVKNSPAVWETWVRSLGWEDPLERAWQPTPVFLPGESPWTEEPGGLQSMGSQRVGHNCETKYSTAHRDRPVEWVS